MNNPDFDLLIRGGMVVTADSVSKLDIGVANGKIFALQENLEVPRREVIDATGLHIFPGVVDAHVHFNEPGRTDWEGFATGSAALAAGGGTLFFDMPLNAHPPTLDVASFDEKLAAAQASSFVDFALWGGLVPGNLDHLEALAERGVVGFKAFMSNSGIEDFPRVDDNYLLEGMKRAARLKKVVAVHAESETITRDLAEQFQRLGNTSVRDYLDSRPVAAEVDAIRRALDMAGETGCALHIVHVSSGDGVALITEARDRGVDVSCETCPHYLSLTEENMIELGAVAKCAPPLRSKVVQEELWRKLKDGNITTIGSDHSPSPPEMKRETNFFKVWGGISGVQHTLPLLITHGHFERELALPFLSRLTSLNVAERFRLPPTKGRIAVEADADFTLVDLQNTFSVESASLLYRHKQSPYIQRKLRGDVRATFVRGSQVFRDGQIVGKPIGNLVKPLVWKDEDD